MFLGTPRSDAEIDFYKLNSSIKQQLVRAGSVGAAGEGGGAKEELQRYLVFALPGSPIRIQLGHLLETTLTELEASERSFAAGRDKGDIFHIL